MIDLIREVLKMMVGPSVGSWKMDGFELLFDLQSNMWGRSCDHKKAACKWTCLDCFLVLSNLLLYCFYPQCMLAISDPPCWPVSPTLACDIANFGSADIFLVKSSCFKSYADVSSWRIATLPSFPNGLAGWLDELSWRTSQLLGHQILTYEVYQGVYHGLSWSNSTAGFI